MQITKENAEFFLDKMKLLGIVYGRRDTPDLELEYHFHKVRIDEGAISEQDIIECITFISRGDDDLLNFLGEKFKYYGFKRCCVNLVNNREFYIKRVFIVEKSEFASVGRIIENNEFQPSPVRSTKPNVTKTPQSVKSVTSATRITSKNDVFKHKKFR